MLNCETFYRALVEEGLDYFAGVPDSLLKDICAFINDEVPAERHTIAANEGAAVALAAGHHLATGRMGLVYLQNSGLGNLVNPLTSLVDPDVYSIPLVLLIGWRGEPGVHDEPQHRKQGRVTLQTLSTLEIPYEVLPIDPTEARRCLAAGIASAKSRQAPFAFVVRKGTFEAYKPRKLVANDHEMSREEAIVAILDSLATDDVVVSTTGMTSREVFEHRAKTGKGHSHDFLTVGCMGHASQIALGIATARPDRLVYCLDGDGAWIMHMGSAAVVGLRQPSNFRQIVINNGAHDSVGGQPTAGYRIDIPAIARACGYRSTLRVATKAELAAALPSFRATEGPCLLEVLVHRGARADLGRPTQTPIKNKADFMQGLGVP